MNHWGMFFKGAIWHLGIQNQPLDGAAENIFIYANDVTGHSEDFGHVCCQPVPQRKQAVKRSALELNIVQELMNYIEFDCTFYHVLLGLDCHAA